MKKAILAISLIAAATSTAVAAKEDGIYVGGAYSMMHYDTIWAADNDVDNGFTAFSGYNFALNDRFVLATEVEYKDLGSTTEKWSNITTTASVTSYGVNLVPKVYFGEHFHLMAKLGYHRFDIEARATAQTGQSKTLNDSDTSAVYGLGLGWDITSNFTLQTTYEVFSASHNDVASANVGVAYNF